MKRLLLIFILLFFSVSCGDVNTKEDSIDELDTEQCQFCNGVNGKHDDDCASL